ncbi:MAG: DUF2510 domain-containing protein [Acidimicrobiales bacterium]
MAEMVIIVVVASVGLYLWLRNGEVLRFETTATAEQVGLQVVGVVGTNRRWATVSQTPTNVAFSYHKKPNVLLAFVLLLFFIVPGILYLVLGSKRESLNVTVVDSGQGNPQVQITSSGFRGKFAGREVAKALGAATGMQPQSAAPQSQPAQVVPSASPQALPTTTASAADAPAAQGTAVAAVGTATATVAPSLPAAGWFPDDEREGGLRWWDGTAWTDHRA